MLETHPENAPATARPTLVLLPGLLCDAAVWEAQCAAMPGLDCIVPDYGLRDSIEAMAQQVLEDVAAPLFALAGHSMGGRVALEMARLAPGRITRLALLDTGFQPRTAGEAGEAEMRERFALLALAREQGMREMGSRWARGMVHPKHLDQPVFEAILAMIARKTPEIFAAQIRALLDRPDALPVLQALRCPTLLLCGRQDTWSPLARHEEMRELVAGSELEVIDDAGHMTTMEQPQAVNAALARWLKD
jgi:pimeloyl-ACP methyl ester carboxylesterase